ncbi:MAG TPA: hypothetical protein PLH36_13825, partial [Armatimonadota bacterium]|nr:hypothetical protein [Armatimonadota bacterium]
ARFRQVYDLGGEHFDPADLSLWQKYRASVRRPIAFIKPADLERARENVRRHPWAKRLLAGYRGRADYVLNQPPEFVEQMIPALTPLCTLFTMCPHCEYAPVHGQYIWDVKRPDELKCRNCGTVYPNEKYPEDLVLVARHGGEQRFTFYGGKSWNFNNIHLRSSWTGAIRAHKTGYMARAARDLAMVYALTGERAYGEKAAAILSRFATVYPGYLIHSGYGEIADMDPRVAAAKINNLPADELTCPPNKPDRRLQAGYWMAGRGFSAVGMEAASSRSWWRPTTSWQTSSRMPSASGSRRTSSWREPTCSCATQRSTTRPRRIARPWARSEWRLETRAGCASAWPDCAGLSMSGSCRTAPPASRPPTAI